MQNSTETQLISGQTRHDSEELEAWTSPTLKPYDFQPEGGSVQGVSDVSVFHS
jgi:hypothetical protein